MIKPYTYLLKQVDTNTFYYGVRWQNVRLELTAQNDLWIKYFTGSKKVKLLIEKYGKDSFIFEIRKEFETIKEARKWETKVLRRMRVLDKPNVWLNRTNNESILNENHPRGTLGKTWKNNYTKQRNKIEKTGNQYTKNTFWITNGNESKMIPIGSDIPEGYIKGTGRTNKRPDLAERNRNRYVGL